MTRPGKPGLAGVIHMSRRAVVKRSSLLIVLGVLLSLFAVGQQARSLTISEPIHLGVASQFTPGQPVSCSVQLTSGPTQITIYSSPAGAVSYSGSVATASATVSATTSSSASGPITVYLKTDGAQICSTVTSGTVNSPKPLPQ